VIYSPLDAVELAVKNPDKQVVFFGVGFETTAPANAMSVHVAKRRGLKNFSLLVSHVLVPPAMEAILSSPHNRVQGFLGPGHVCTVVGYEEYEPLAERFRVPIVITGFEPLDILEGVLMVVRQLEQGSAKVENQYSRVLGRHGNAPAQKLIGQVFTVTSRKWRGVGTIPQSGFALSEAFRDFDAERRFSVESIDTAEPSVCIAGQILQGIKKPHDCPAFGAGCNPQHPLGATMVSAEGACAAYYAYGRHLNDSRLVSLGGPA
jgi:hydrogenase expression/formation protein HypD